MLSIPDVLLLALGPLLALAVASYFATQRSLESSRPLDGFTVGASIAAALAGALLVFLPGEAYYLGLKGIVPVALLWLIVPLVAWNILPGMVGPTIGSPLAYLKLRFGERTAFAASILYLLGRLLIASLALAGLARMLSLAEGLQPMALALGVGLFATICGACCGRRGGVWLSVLLLAIIFVSLPFAIATVIKQDGDPSKIWQVGQLSQRTWIGDPSLTLSDSGVTWTLLPFAWTALLIVLLGDEATASRLALLRSAESVRTALITLITAVSIFALAGMYVGLSLFVYFREHPRDVRLKWVTNVEPESKLSRTEPGTWSPILDPATGKPKQSLLSDNVQYDRTTGTPVLTWDETDMEPESLNHLIEQRRLYARNSEFPIASRDEVCDEAGDIDSRKLASYSVPQPGRPSEMILHRRATEELWPYFVATFAPTGMRGLLLGGLLAAALAVVDVTSVMGLPAVQQWFPTRTAGAGRTLSAIANLAIMLLAMMGVFLLPFPADALLFVLASSLAPLAALVMLGLTSRRATAGVAMAALTSGVLAATAFSVLLCGDQRARIHPMWSVTLSFLFTLVVGHLLALIFGEARRRGELQGLVLGAVPIGAIHEHHQAAIQIPEPLENQ
jgi:hypothetical protein